MKFKNKYFVSSVLSSEHDLLAPLIKRLRNKGYKTIQMPKGFSNTIIYKNNLYFNILEKLVRNFFWKIYLNLFVLTQKDSKIIFAWPQKIGYDIILKAIKHNKVILYIMDNSFFCIRSYNTNPTTNKECLDCLGSIKPHKLCSSFPKKYSKKKNVQYLELLKNSSDQIIFYSQNKLQKSLLKKHFGNKTIIKVVGMNIELKKSAEIFKHKYPVYDIVFHGRSLISKGLIYIIKLAEYLPNQTFLIPDSKENVLKVLDKKNTLSNNIIFKKMNWENGLKEAVISAQLVINPSMWSAPIEGALVKSAIYNQNVATVETIYGYEKEIGFIKNHIRLSTDIPTAAKQLKYFFNNNDN